MEAVCGCGLLCRQQSKRYGVIEVAAREKDSLFFLLQAFQLGGEDFADAFFGHIDLSGVDVEGVAGFFHGPFIDAVAFENLVLFEAHLFFEEGERALDEAARPFFAPDAIQFRPLGIGEIGERVILILSGLLGWWLALLFFEMLGQPRSGDGAQPAFEAAATAVVLKTVETLVNFENGFLHDVLRISFRKPGTAGHAVNEFPIGVEKHFPTFAVDGGFESVDEAAAGLK